MDHPHNPKNDAPGDKHRRTLLVRWVQWALAVTTALFLYPLVQFAGFKAPRRPRLVDVPAPLPTSGTHTSHDFLLFATEDGGAKAVSRICTHLGCRVNYLQDKEYIECPCHQSRFTSEGVRISGPAERDLPTFEVTQKVDGEGRVTAYVVHL